MQISVGKTFYIDSAHRLSNDEGKCKNIHGHTYKIDVEITGTLDSKDMIIHFSDMGGIVQSVLANYDHALWIKNLKDKSIVNDEIKFVLFDTEPTVENLTIKLFGEISKVLPNERMLKISCIKVWEGDGKWCKITN